ncbi:MAG: hypothetical protein O7H41_11475 [Planctomycetota bacterium]|nr:hypothetical protein [Planctomycetota bacterium]
MSSLTPIQREEVSLAVADLQYLRHDWDATIEDDTLRRGSVALRLLMVDDTLGRAWRSVGLTKEPRIKTVDLDSGISGFEKAKIEYAQSAGGRFGGLRMGPPLFVVGQLTEKEEVLLRQPNLFGEPRSFGLSEYLASTAIVVRGAEVTRREVIQYVANKKGGAHLDDRRDSSKKREVAFLALDSIPEKAKIAGKHPVYFELLSIGQTTAGAEDIGVFLVHAKKCLAE